MPTDPIENLDPSLDADAQREIVDLQRSRQHQDWVNSLMGEVGDMAQPVIAQIVKQALTESAGDPEDSDVVTHEPSGSPGDSAGRGRSRRKPSYDLSHSMSTGSSEGKISSSETSVTETSESEMFERAADLLARVEETQERLEAAVDDEIDDLGESESKGSEQSEDSDFEPEKEAQELLDTIGGEEGDVGEIGSGDGSEPVGTDVDGPIEYDTGGY